jgi:hypothetical protein
MENPVMEDEGIYGEFFSNQTTQKSTRISEHLTLWKSTLGKVKNFQLAKLFAGI